MKTTPHQKETSGQKPGFKTRDHVEAFLAGGYFCEENDAAGHLQCMGTAALAAVARGELDLNALARIELAARGHDENGQWVGFEKARRIAGARLAKNAGPRN